MRKKKPYQRVLMDALVCVCEWTGEREARPFSLSFLVRMWGTQAVTCLQTGYVRAYFEARLELLSPVRELSNGGRAGELKEAEGTLIFKGVE